MQWGTEEAVLGWELDFPICSLHHWEPVKDQMPMLACAAQSAAPSLHAILLSHRHNLTALGSFCARIFILFSFFYLLFSFLNSRAILSSALHQQRGRQPGNLNLEASVCCFWLWAGSGFGAEMLSELKWLSDRIRETNPGELVRASRHGAAWQQRSKPTFQHGFGSSHLILQKLSVPGNGVGSTMLGGQGRPQWEASLLGCISALFLALTSPPSCMEILVSRAMFAGSGLWKVIAARGPCSPALLLPADVCISCSVAARRKNHVLEIKNCSNCRKMPFLASPGCLPLPLIQQFVRTWYAVQMPLL